jgi:hypothetical protein
MLARLPSAENPFMENYAIVLKSVSEGMEKGERGGMIGVIGIPRLSHDGLAAEVGYAITPDFRGRGYASEALILFVRHYFNSERKSLIAVPISRLSVCLSVCLSFFHSSFVCSYWRGGVNDRGSQLMITKEHSRKNLS